MRPLHLLVGLVALALAACSQGDAPQASKSPSAPRAAAPQAPAAAPATTADIDPALKERLARQEAAAKMFEKNVLQPPAPKAAQPEPPPPAPAAPPKVEPKPEPRVEVAKAPVRTEPAPPPAAPKQAAPKPAPAKAEPPPRTDLAAAKPSSAPGPAPAIRLVTRVDPDFPREAIQAGVDKGTVKARMTLDETGNVTRVEVVEANPRRVFDRAVVRALTQWRYNDGAAGRTVEAEVDFNR